MDVNCQHSSTLFSRKDQSAADGSKEISNDTEDYRDIREVEDSTDCLVLQYLAYVFEQSGVFYHTVVS